MTFAEAEVLGPESSALKIEAFQSFERKVVQGEGLG